MSSGTWSSPQTPLTPDRLAKIANALGVSTPIPASPSRTPPPTSSYLVHVVPPLTLPHLNNLVAPPPPTASGYHTHFRRGTLLPVYATLQLQLAAIAREYALPSTSGLILYLVQEEEPGPRISEDIWKHLWARVWKAEFAPDAPQKLPALTLNTPKLDQAPSVRASPTERSAVPIVAKVEFDIDIRTASWLNPWITSRNLNHSKRMDSNNSPIVLNLPRTPRSEHASLLGDDDYTVQQPSIYRKNIPPRLILDTFGTPSLAPSSSSLAYLQQAESSDDETEIEDDVGPASGKRGGGVYDDLELDFDDSFVETEESQYLLTAQLDEIEKNMAQFSPRVLSVGLEEEQAVLIPVRTDLPPPSPINPTASWPAVPFTSLNSPLPLDSGNTPAPPQLALNGVTTSAPKSYNPTTSSTPSAESMRRKQLEEEEWGSPQAQYPHLTPKVTSSDTVIPLSPDPFGRFASSTPPTESRGSTYWESGSSTVGTTSSRFSADSVKDEVVTNPNRATVMSVKSIKRLWRRSSKQSVSLQQQMPPPPGRLSPNGEPFSQAHRSSESFSSNRNSVQQLPSRSTAPSPTLSGSPSSRPSRPSTRPPSLHNFDIPAVNDSVYPAPPATTISLDRLRFDQESPYPTPTRRARAPPLTSFPSTGSLNGRVSPSTPTPPSGKSSPVPTSENPRNSVRKSILKWKSGSGGRARSTSMLSANNERPVTDKMPPSPRIPEQFLQHQQAQATHVHGKSVSSMAPSVISLSKSISSNGSRMSEDEGRGPSIDESQFEMVSPKAAPHALSYPYSAVDQV